MQHTVNHGQARAVDNSDRKHWRKAGKVQFDYLKKHGLKPQDRLLEIGCGNLRAGWRIIEFLDAGHYYGNDISPEVLTNAQDTLVRQGVIDKGPHLSLVEDLRFGDLEDEAFDVVHAHSVFSHTPLSLIEQCFSHVGRILRPDGFFDFTFNRTDGKERSVLREDFYYQTQTLLDLARRCGLEAQFMDDWEELGERQSKIRVRRARST